MQTQHARDRAINEGNVKVIVTSPNEPRMESIVFMIDPMCLHQPEANEVDSKLRFEFFSSPVHVNEPD